MSQRQFQIIEFADGVSDMSRHFALWSFLVHPETRQRYRAVFDDYEDFFTSTTVAHFQSALLLIYQLLDERDDIISIRKMLAEIETFHGDIVHAIRLRLNPHEPILKSLASIRSKVYAHRDSRFGPELVFAEANISPNAPGACVDVLCDIMNTLFFRLVPNREEFEFYQEATHRADMATQDAERMLEILAKAVS